MHIRCLARSTRTANLDALTRDFKGADLQIVRGNLSARETCMIAASGVSVIYHLAAGVDKTFPGCVLNSVVTTRNLLDAAIKEDTLKRFVNISSLALYSNAKLGRTGLMDESCETEPSVVERQEPYLYGKAKQDELVLAYAKKHGLPYVLVRPGVVFGPGKAQITGRIGIDTFGVFLHLGLNNRIPLTYVDNCAEAIVLAGLKRGIEGQVINVVDDDLPTSREFLRLYKKQVRRFRSVPVPYPIFYLFCFLWEKYSQWSLGQLPPVFNRRKCAAYWKGNRYSNKKAHELLGWHPRVRMSDALERYFIHARSLKEQL
jgi:nucleoside-diphosphate-sugar epimerase